MRTPSTVLILCSSLGLAGCGLGLESYAKYTDTGASLDDEDDDGGGVGGDDDGGGSGDDGSGDGGGGSGSSGSGSSGSGSGSSGSGSGGSGGDADNDGDGYPASYDCDDNDPALNWDDYDGDLSTTCDGDCDDRDGFTYPGAAWAESSTACMTDLDGDGYGEMYPASGVTGGSDCNDRDSTIFPGALDTDGDGVDQDCDGADSGGGGGSGGGSGGGGPTVTVSGTTGTIVDYFDNYYYAIVTGGCTYVSDITFSIDLDHYYMGDLFIVLQEPGGLGALIFDGGDWDADGVSDWDGTSSSLTTTMSIGVGTATVYGDGTWTLIVQDLDPIIDGTLNSWSLTLTCY